MTAITAVSINDALLLQFPSDGSNLLQPPPVPVRGKKTLAEHPDIW
ncbi:hypothetical protein [Marinimicrobium sp. ARAG 43.8]